MQIGVHLGYQNLHHLPDADFFRRETQIAIEAEAMGFRFRRDGGASFHRLCRLSRSAPGARLRRGQDQDDQADVGSVILPWNDPLRVVERASQLDHLSEGASSSAWAAAAARREFEGFVRIWRIRARCSTKPR